MRERLHPAATADAGPAGAHPDLRAERGAGAGLFAERRVRTFLQLRRTNLDDAITALDDMAPTDFGEGLLGREVADADVVLLRWPGLRARLATGTAGR